MNSKKVPETVKVDLVTAPVVITNCWRTQCRLSKSSVPKNTGLRDYLERFDWYDFGPDTCSADCVHTAETFAAAFNVLSAFAKDTNAPLRTSTQRAAAWRALATKPPIPDEVNVQRLMAEDAIKENKPDEALNYYEGGIELYPTWPEGNFNAALIAAELKYFADAIEHMQAYLELVPNAADAQAAQEKILIWQVKAKQ
jgi:tetratricopeptide (TPR) repeat protein